MFKSHRDLKPKDIIQYITGSNQVVLEIGCNDGTDTNKLLELLPSGTVYCFEPDPRALARFRETVNNERAILTEAAISNQDGEATFYGSSGRPPEKSRHVGASHYCYLEEWDLSGSLCKPTGHLDFSPWTTFPEDRQYTVSTLRLDTWLLTRGAIDIIDFIWCDVQGAEAQVILGAPNALAKTRYFYTEFYDNPLYEGQLPLTELQKMLPGFELLGIHGDNALFKNRGM